MVEFESIEAIEWLRKQKNKKGSDNLKILKLFRETFKGKYKFINWKSRSSCRAFVNRVLGEIEEGKECIWPHKDEYKRLSTEYVENKLKYYVKKGFDKEESKQKVTNLYYKNFGEYKKDVLKTTFEKKVGKEYLRLFGEYDINIKKNEANKILIYEDEPNDEDVEYQSNLEFCDICTMNITSVHWKVGCYHPNCNKAFHFRCMCHDECDEQWMYCSQHWIEQFVGDNNIHQGDGTLVRRIPDKQIGGFIYYFRKNIGDKYLGYYKYEKQLNESEAIQAETFEYKYSDLDLQYGFRKIKGKDVALELLTRMKYRNIRVDRYMTMNNFMPFISGENFLHEEATEMLANKGNDMMDNGAKWIKDFPDSVQFTKKKRIKVHAEWFYSTSKANDSKLRRCKLKFHHMFSNKRERYILRNILVNLYRVAIETTSMTHKDLAWLLKDPSLGLFPFLITTYNGGNLNAHVDKNFYGPVFVITVYVKAQDGKCPERGDAKWICYGQKGHFVHNAHAQIPNYPRQFYCFYGFLTDYGVHGVPLMKGWRAIVLIIRQGRVCDGIPYID